MTPAVFLHLSHHDRPGFRSATSFFVSLAFIVKTLSEVNPLHVGAVVVGLGSIVIVSGGLLGYLKLRSRDMSALLEALWWYHSGKIERGADQHNHRRVPRSFTSREPQEVRRRSTLLTV